MRTKPLYYEAIAIIAILTILNMSAMVKADGQAGTTLSAEVTATAYWTRTFS